MSRRSHIRRVEAFQVEHLEARALLDAAAFVGPTVITVLDAPNTVQATAVVEGLTPGRQAILNSLDAAQPSDALNPPVYKSNLRLTWNDAGVIRSRRVGVVPGLVTELTVADINNDGIDDVVAEGISSSLSGRSIWVFMGQDSGRLRLRQIIRPTNAFKIAVGDMNGGGNLELVIANERVVAGPNSVFNRKDLIDIYTFTDDQFSLSRRIRVGDALFTESATTSISIVDSDADGDADIVATGSRSSFVLVPHGSIVVPPAFTIQVRVVEQTPSGFSFHVTTLVQVPDTAALPVLFRNISGDARPEMIFTTVDFVYGFTASSYVTRVMAISQSGAGDYVSAPVELLTITGAEGGITDRVSGDSIATRVVDVRDVDGDSDPDIILGTRFSRNYPFVILPDLDTDVPEGFTRSWLTVATNNGAGSFSRSEPLHLDQKPLGRGYQPLFALADFDADGTLDAVRSSIGTVDVIFDFLNS